jgi:hypothetical protein
LLVGRVELIDYDKTKRIGRDLLKDVRGTGS